MLLYIILARAGRTTSDRTNNHVGRTWRGNPRMQAQNTGDRPPTMRERVYIPKTIPMWRLLPMIRRRSGTVQGHPSRCTSPEDEDFRVSTRIGFKGYRTIPQSTLVSHHDVAVSLSSLCGVDTYLYCEGMLSRIPPYTTISCCV